MKNLTCEHHTLEKGVAAYITRSELQLTELFEVLEVPAVMLGEYKKLRIFDRGHMLAVLTSKPPISGVVVGKMHNKVLPWRVLGKGERGAQKKTNMFIARVVPFSLDAIAFRRDENLLTMHEQARRSGAFFVAKKIPTKHPGLK